MTNSKYSKALDNIMFSADKEFLETHAEDFKVLQELVDASNAKVIVHMNGDKNTNIRNAGNISIKLQPRLSDKKALETVLFYRFYG